MGWRHPRELAKTPRAAEQLVLAAAWKDTGVGNTGEEDERQNFVEQSNVGSPEPNGNGYEDLRLVGRLSRGTAGSSTNPWKKGSRRDAKPIEGFYQSLSSSPAWLKFCTDSLEPLQKIAALRQQTTTKSFKIKHDNQAIKGVAELALCLQGKMSCPKEKPP